MEVCFPPLLIKILLLSLISFLNFEDYPVLSENDNISCENEISTSEISLALKSLNNYFLAGCDGPPTPCYKVLLNKLKYILLGSFREAILTGELSVSQKRGILTLLH